MVIQGFGSADSEKNTVRTQQLQASHFAAADASQGVMIGSAYSVDLESGSGTDIGAYPDKKRGIEEIMQQARNTDTAIRHNYMSLMANTVSDEDFAKACEEGFDLSDTAPEESVTILDHIKAAVAMSGADIKGFTDDLDERKLTAITGSEGLSRSIQKNFAENDLPVTEENVRDTVMAATTITSLGPLTDGAVRYMTENDLAPSADNLYLAEHSGADQRKRFPQAAFYAQEGGYFAQKADNPDLKGLEGQIEKIVEEAGFTADNDSVMQQAKWMIETGIPLTPENLEKSVSLRALELPVDEERAVRAASIAIAGGRDAQKARLDMTENDYELASRYAEEYNRVTDDDLKNAIADGKPLNLKSFREEAADRIRPAIKERPESMPLENDPVLLRARRDLEQIRLSMSTEANLRMMRQGVKIDTAKLGDLVKALDDAIEGLEKSLFPEEKDNSSIGGEDPKTGNEQQVTMISGNKYMLFKETIVRVDRVRTAPVDMVGRLAEQRTEKEPTLRDICDTGERLRERSLKAQDTYEALMTAPRADLGDSIKKAFRNVDDILQDLDMELTEENRRSVRILAYNHMEIDPENIEKIRTFDRKLVSTIDSLKPESVLQLIRDGKNPLAMTLDELRQEMNDRNRDKDRSEQKYSRFLYKLEKNADITSEERESYIGIYRLFHRLKATDDAAIGALVKTHAQMTLGNLLTAVRSNKIEGRGLDVKVDEDFGGLVAGRRINSAIDDQIRAAFEYYSAQADVVIENLEPEKLHQVKPDENTTLPELAEGLEQAEADEAADREYSDMLARDLRGTIGSRAAEKAAEELAKFDTAVTAANIKAMQRIRAGRSGRQSVWDDMEKLAHRSYAGVKQEMLETLGEAEDYRQGYKDALSSIGDELYEMAMDETAERLDAAALGLIRKQLSLAVHLAEQDSYEIPVEIEGQTVSMHVTLTKDEGTSGRKISASVSTVDHGELEMAAAAGGGSIKGLLTSSYGSEDGQKQYMEGVRDRFVEELERSVPSLMTEGQDIGILYRSTDAVDKITGVENGFSDTKELLRMARAFIMAVAAG